MAEAGRFSAGETTMVLRDDSVEQDPEMIRQHLERIGRIYRKCLAEEERRGRERSFKAK